MPEGLKIVIDADTKKAEKALSKLGDSVETLRAKLLARQQFLLTETDVTKVAKYNTEIKALQSEIDRIGKIGGSSFGKIGEKAGDAFGAVRKLAFILPGIGIAGLFDAAFQGISKLIGAIGQAGNKFNEAAVDAQVFRAANEKVGDDAARLQALVSVAKDVTLSTTERKNAIAELQRLYPDYLRNINLENINSAEASKAIDDLTKSIINKAIAEIFSHKVAEETLKLMDLQQKAQELLEKQNKATKEILAHQDAPISALSKLRGQLDFITAQLGDVGKAANDQQEVVNKLTGKLKQATIAELDFTKTAKPERQKAASDFDLIHNLLEILKRDAADLQKFFRPIAEAAKNIRINIGANINLDTLGTNFGGQEDKISSNLKRSIDQLTKDNPILLEAKIRQEDMDKVGKRFEDFTKKINTSVENIQIGAIESIGEAIGTALTGGNLGQIFSGFGNIIGSGLQEIGKQLVLVGGLAKLTQKALAQLFLNPALAIGAGIALIAAGAALKASLGKGVKGFAEGGLVFGPTVGLVGEGSATSRANPEVIAPLDKLRGILSGSGASGGRQRLKVRGQDILLVSARSTKSNNQLG